jgi:hypothetical protein
MPWWSAGKNGNKERIVNNDDDGFESSRTEMHMLAGWLAHNLARDKTSLLTDSLESIKRLA